MVNPAAAEAISLMAMCQVFVFRTVLLKAVMSSSQTIYSQWALIGRMISPPLATCSVGCKGRAFPRQTIYVDGNGT